MDSKYERIEFTKLQDINNLEYYVVYSKIKIKSIIRRSKKVIPKLKKIFKSKILIK